MNIKECIKKNGWQIECVSKICRAMNVDVTFINNSNKEDETQFSINAYDSDELSKLFTDFCRENGFKTNSVVSVTIVEMAETFNELS